MFEHTTEHITLDTLDDNRFKVINLIPIEIEYYSDVIVTKFLSTCSEIGKTQEEAISAIKQKIISSYYRALSDSHSDNVYISGMAGIWLRRFHHYFMVCEKSDYKLLFGTDKQLDKEFHYQSIINEI